MANKLERPCMKGARSNYCPSVSPCLDNGLCYSLGGKIPKNILTKNPNNRFTEMASNCRLPMYQSNESCPKHCQWLGGKTQRCQKKPQRVIKSQYKQRTKAKSREIARALRLAKKQKKNK